MATAGQSSIFHFALARGRAGVLGRRWRCDLVRGLALTPVARRVNLPRAVGARFLLSWSVLIAALATHGRWCSPPREQRCSMDGNRMEPLYQVELASDGRVHARFCSLSCARDWPAVPPGSWWQVRDEVTGEALDAARAHFVASRIVTVPARAERVHAFAHWADAQAHAERHGGHAVPNPLASTRLDPRSLDAPAALEPSPLDDTPR